MLLCCSRLPQAYIKKRPEHKAGETHAKVMLWAPKLQGTKEGNEYDPRTKDWASVGYWGAVVHERTCQWCSRMPCRDSVPALLAN